MAVCDICSAPGMGTIVSAEQMKKAVFQKGFNPFALGLVNMQIIVAMGGNPEQAYPAWKATTVAQDYSDWNICDRCMGHLRNYMDEPPKPAGISHAQVSMNPLTALQAGIEAEEKYGSGSENKKIGDTSGQEKKSGCFVATACYQDYDAPEVVTLRRFRDEKMMNNPLSRCLVRLYYFASPPLASQIDKHPNLRVLVRRFLIGPIVTLVGHKD